VAKRMSHRGHLILLLVILSLGLAMMAGLTWAFDESLAPRSWDRVECRIQSSEILTTDEGYEFVVAYAYRYGGREYQSSTVTRWYGREADYDRSRAYLDAYREGSLVACLVNPDAPEEAALGWTVEWSLLALMVLPLVFLVGGGFGLRQWLLERRGRRVLFVWGGFWPGAIVFGSIFGVGVLYFVLLFLVPSAEVVSSVFWRQIPCTVVSSRVMTWPSDGDNLPNLVPDVLFEYAWDGQRYRSNRFDVIERPSSDSEAVEEEVARYPTGRDTLCYLDPDRPAGAVLNRSFRPGLLIHAVFSLPFILFGFMGIRAHVRSR